MSHDLDAEAATPSTMATTNSEPSIFDLENETNNDDDDDDTKINNLIPSVRSSSPTPSMGNNKPSWTSQDEEDTIVIEEELPDATPLKKGWGSGQNRNSNGSNVNSFNTAAEARSKQQQQQQQQLGSKPKLTNMSLLSSAVAHATLERCLLGVNGGGDATASTSTSAAPSNNENDDGDDARTRSNNKSTATTTATTTIDYSKQCKPGHVIDILELRRLSSRGVPDEPPETRSRAVSAPATLNPISEAAAAAQLRSDDTINAHDSINAHLDNNINDKTRTHISSPTGGANPHRSYRPLVWRVLLGYLPPQTSLWNDVLERDRQLYGALVKELFSSTCPNPHDVFGEEELQEREEEKRKRKKEQSRENEVYKSDGEGGGRAFVIDDDDDDDDDAPGTPVEDATPPAAPTPLTPGLLSARMQQEWVRGEAGKDSIFDGQGASIPGGGGDMARLSPMCAMNTPRKKIRKEVFKSKEDVLTEENENNQGDESSGYGDKEKGDSLSANKGGSEGGDLANQMKASLLLPNDGDDSDDEECTTKVGSSEGMDTTTDNRDMSDININNLTEEEDKGGSSPATSESPTAKLAHSISITNTGSEEENCEGVELCRQNSQEDDDDTKNYLNDDSDTMSRSPIPPMPPTAETIDEEENIHLLDEIRKDVIRTHPDLRFFLEPNEDLGQKRYAALERILFVWAKLNKGVRYVQGMNEIVGTLYFVLAHDSNEDWANQAEPDTYFLFNSLMVEMRDVFVPDLDDADTGIHGRISNMITLLSLHDPEVRCHLDSVGIDPSFYSVRWLTTLLSREFLLPDTIRLWDSMFASTHKDNFLRYVSVTMVMLIRDQLLSGDFSACLRLLQAYPPTNLDRLLESSRALWIYESQITLACHKGGISLGHALRSIAPPPAIVMAYGLQGGVAPPIRQQVREVGERGLRVARGAANGASNTVASAGRSFFGNAMNYMRGGSGGEKGQAQGKEVRRSKSTM